MRVVERAVVLSLAGLTALGAVGCNRSGGNGGTTTIIQQPGGGNAGSSSFSSSAAPASAAPINDPKELCHQVLQKTRGLSNAANAFWKVVISRDGWTYTDPDVNDAVTRVEKEFPQIFPAIDGIVGKSISADAADVTNNYLKDFSNAIIEQQKNDILNPAASSFGRAKDKLVDTCGSTN